MAWSVYSSTGPVSPHAHTRNGPLAISRSLYVDYCVFC